MTEADMEILIKDYPHEFFQEKLAFVSQQERFSSGIADLIFKDEQGRIIVVELKRGNLRREGILQAISQILDLRPCVVERYGEPVELWVVANSISEHRQEIPDLFRVPVTFKEIPQSRFKEVARKYGISLSVKPHQQSQMPIKGNCDRERVMELIEELKGYPDRMFVMSFGEELKRELKSSNFEFLPEKTVNRLGRWCHPNQWHGREKWVKPRACELSILLFGTIIPRVAEEELSRGSSATNVMNEPSAPESYGPNLEQRTLLSSVKPLLVLSLVSLVIISIYNAVLWNQMWNVAEFVGGLLYVIPFTLLILAVNKYRQYPHVMLKLLLTLLCVGLYAGTIYLIIIVYGRLSRTLFLVLGLGLHLSLLFLAKALKDNYIRVKGPM